MYRTVEMAVPRATQIRSTYMLSKTGHSNTTQVTQSLNPLVILLSSAMRLLAIHIQWTLGYPTPLGKPLIEGNKYV